MWVGFLAHLRGTNFNICLCFIEDIYKTTIYFFKNKNYIFFLAQPQIVYEDTNEIRIRCRQFNVFMRELKEGKKHSRIYINGPSLIIWPNLESGS